MEALLEEYGIVLTPYRTTAEYDVLAGAFVDDTDRNLMFRIYVPSGHVFADESDTLMRLFREWLAQIGHLSIRQDGYKTGAGQVFEFFGDGGPLRGHLAHEMDEFADFISACMNDPGTAARELRARGIEEAVADRFITRFARDGNRLQLDLRHTRERRLLDLRQLFEAGILELGSAPAQGATAALEAASQLNPFRSLVAPPSVLGASGSVVNIGAQSTINVYNAISANLTGVDGLSDEGRALLELIARSNSADAAEFTTAVHEPEDAEAHHTDRLKARQRLKGFLIRVGHTMKDPSIAILQKYVEKKMGLV